MIGRVRALVLACAFAPLGAGLGFAEPHPVSGLRPAEHLLQRIDDWDHPAAAGALNGVDALPVVVPAASGALPESSVERVDSPPAPARAASPGLADTLKPAGEITESRSKP